MRIECVSKWRQKQERKLDIAIRNAVLRDRRSPREQLHVLDRRLGRGVGAVRERVRLYRAIGMMAKARV
jgi:hypothetical protein